MLFYMERKPLYSRIRKSQTPKKYKMGRSSGSFTRTISPRSLSRRSIDSKRTGISSRRHQSTLGDFLGETLDKLESAQFMKDEKKRLKLEPYFRLYSSIIKLIEEIGGKINDDMINDISRILKDKENGIKFYQLLKEILDHDEITMLNDFIKSNELVENVREICNNTNVRFNTHLLTKRFGTKIKPLTTIPNAVLTKCHGIPLQHDIDGDGARRNKRKISRKRKSKKSKMTKKRK